MIQTEPRRNNWLYLILIAAFLSTMSGSCRSTGTITSQTTTPATNAFAKPIAVFPLQNRTGHPELDWISIGFQESLSVDLWYASELNTKPLPVFNAAIQHHCPEMDLACVSGSMNNPDWPAVAKEHGLGHFIWGGYEVRGQKLRVELKLFAAPHWNAIKQIRFKARVDQLLSKSSEALIKLVTKADVPLSQEEKQRMLSKKTDSVDAWMNTALGFWWQQKFDVATDENRNQLQAVWKNHLKKAVELDPDYAEAHNNLGWFWLVTKDWNQGTDAFKQALAYKPHLVDANMGRGYCLFESGHAEDAIPFYRHGLALNTSLTNHQDYLMKTLRASNKPNDGLNTADKLLLFLADKSRNADQINLIWWKGVFHGDLKQWDKALFAYDQVETYYLEKVDQTTPKNLLMYKADAYFFKAKELQQSKRYNDAITYFYKALKIDAQYRQEDASIHHNHIGAAYSSLGNYTKALAHHKKALAIQLKAIGIKHAEIAASYKQIGSTYSNLRNYDGALEAYNLAEEYFSKNGQEKELREIFKRIAKVYTAQADELKEAKDYESALKSLYNALEIGSKSSSALAPPILTKIGNIYEILGDKIKSQEYHSKSKSIGQFVYQNTLGRAYNFTENYKKSLDHHIKALELCLKTPGIDQRYTADAHHGVGDAYSALGHYSMALKHFKKELHLRLEVLKRDPQAIAIAYNSIGLMYKKLNAFSESLAHYKMTLKENGFLGDNHFTIANAFMGLGETYSSLGSEHQALVFYKKALSIMSNLGKKPCVADCHIGMGKIYRSLGNKEKALELHQKALDNIISGRGKESTDAATGHLQVAIDYFVLEKYSKGADHLVKGLEIQKKILGDEHILTSHFYFLLGTIYGKARKYGEALSLFQKTLTVVQRVHGIEHTQTAACYAAISIVLNNQNKINEAIFFGKMGVNILQNVRSSISSVDKEIQQLFVKSNSSQYRSLADLLIEQGRLPEAHQVLSMLKEEEYFDFIRRDAKGRDVRTTVAAFNAVEQPWAIKYKSINSRIASLGKELGTLKQKAKLGLSDEEKARRKALKKELKAATRAFDHYMSELIDGLGKVSTDRAHEIGAKNLGSLKAFKSTLRELGHGAVCLHYLSMEDKLRIIVTTPDVQLARDSAISAKALNRQIIELRQALQNPKVDVRDKARQLYDAVIGPIARDLDQAGAQTLMLSLDGTLRYLPVAALHDGRQWMAEKYGLVIFTEAAKDKIKDRPAAQWRLAGLGLSDKVDDAFNALPGVEKELEGIVIKDSADTDGVLAGEIHLNSAFTTEAFEDCLDKQYPVLHIASHFVFKPGQEKDSFLLMGDGSRLSLADIKDDDYDFGPVELLTLSACDTATGGTGADGREIEGFGALAQHQGAKAVLATLWPVADTSTGLFMQQLYRLRAANPGMTKAEALRQAQLMFIRGQSVETHAADDGHRGRLRLNRNKDDKTSAFKTDPDAPYAHPYYWAPFILMGNWL